MAFVFRPLFSAWQMPLECFLFVCCTVELGFSSQLLIKHKQKVTCDKHVRGLGVTQDSMTGPLAKQAFSKQPRDFECRDIEMRRMKDG